MKTSEMLPQSDYDFNSIIKLADLPDEDFRKTVSELLPYIKDSEHPLFSFVCDLLVLKQSVAVKSIKNSFTHDDPSLQNNLLEYVLPRLNRRNKTGFRAIINNAVKNPTLSKNALLCRQYLFESKPLIRPAGLFDADRIADTKLKIWQETFSEIYPAEKLNNYDHAKYVSYFSDKVNDPNSSLYVVEMDGEICGYMCCGTADKPFQHITQEISQLCLMKKVQKQGIGTTLFELAKNIISFKGHDEFTLCCNKYNYPAQKFYENKGGRIMAVDEDDPDRSKPQIRYYYRISG